MTSVRKRATALMFQGTASDVGKSLVVTGLCRLFTNRGWNVKPFKPQNMSNNAAVTQEGGEISRAQALQARACRTPPTVHMNPVLLKPQDDKTGVQVLVHGRFHTVCSARNYTLLKSSLLPFVLQSFDKLGQEANLLLVEGAGSPAEINLRTHDIANMGFAEAVDLPVILIGDIEKGGVLASIVGTYTLITKSEQQRLKGYIINKFRGDSALFDDGLAEITRRTHLPSLGVIPYTSIATSLPAEDTLGLVSKPSSYKNALRIAVPQFPRISNFDDLDPLRLESDVSLLIIPPEQPLPLDCDMIILPGSKSTIHDFLFLKQQGWDIDLQAFSRQGGFILGLCGGFQMLGRTIHDPQGQEGQKGIFEGLCLLNIHTLLSSEKTVTSVQGYHCASGTSVSGYEIHLGQTTGPDLKRPFLQLQTRPDGAVSQNGRIAGCYVHGLFSSDSFRHAFLSSLKKRKKSSLNFETRIDFALDALSEHLDRSLDIDYIIKLITSHP